VTAAALLLAALVSLAAATPAAAAKHAYAVIASGDVDAGTMSLADVRRIFLLDRRFWKPGKPVVTLMPPNGSSQRAFVLGKLCSLTEPGYRQFVLGKMYRGELDLAPKVVASDEDAAAFVAASRGAIAIVDAEAAHAHECHVLRVAGKLPGDEGYPLSD
jgi:hypothetical protein